MHDMQIIDGDGHLFEDTEAIARNIPSPYREDAPWTEARQFAPIDHLHVHIGKLLPGAFAGGKHVGPEEWLTFLDQVGIDATVLYPTRGLGYGRITDLDWARTITRAYNDWLSETYVRRSDRFNGMALIPMQEPAEAVKELRRAVEELGMVGAMLPSMGLAHPLGAKVYWPVYEEAERLGCALGVHGGSHSGLGMDHFNVYAPVHSLGHPFGQLVGFGSLVFNGVFDKFPGVKIGFLEAGVAWLYMALERFDRSYSTHVPYDPRGELIRLQGGENVRDYVVRNIKEGRIYIGCEGEEPELPNLVKQVGVEPFFFSSDYPHEVNAEMCEREIEEILETPELNDEQKQAILARNAQRFYTRMRSLPARSPVGAAVAAR